MSSTTPRFLLRSALLCAALTLAPVFARAAKAPPPPPTTAKSWAIANAATGEILWAKEGDTPRKAASTTKVMCAYTVLQLAEKDPAVLDEQVTFSELAAATKGSSAKIHAGESVSVRDCLYGLLLPSGNDAGNALAEHFNDRLAPPDDALLAAGLGNPKLHTRANFIAEMNRHARRIGLTNTLYLLPFGDGGGSRHYTTTAADLCRVGRQAMQLPGFRTIVAARAHTGTVHKADGKTRKITWANKNKLLALDEGYDGIKGGTTKASGYSLVSSGHHGSDHLYVAVLGSTSDEARYTETRQLFRWAWLQR